MVDRIRVVIADDQAVVRESIRAALACDSHIEVVGEAADGGQALAMVRRLKPDIALVDLRMPEVDGLSALEGIGGTCPETKGVALSILSERQCVREVFNVGAAGYIVKGEGGIRLADIVRKIANGETYVDPLVRRQLMFQLLLAGSEGLNEAEKGLLRLIGDGKSDRAIAQRMHIEEAEASEGVSALLAKLDFNEPVQRLAAELRRTLS